MRSRIAAVLLICALIMPRSAIGATIFVDATATGANDGSSWTNAFASLAPALLTASPGDDIWVAAGTYTPGANRTDTFQLISGVEIYGGFAGTETLLTQRNYATNVTVLSGEIGTTSNADNSHHVVTGDGVDNTAVLDGFTVTRGNALGGPSMIGGGIVCDAGEPTIRNTIVNDNTAAVGGGLFIRNGSPQLTNVLVFGNSADTGGGVTIVLSDAVLTNVTIASNAAGLNGGGMSSAAGTPVLTNCVVYGNTSPGNPNVYYLSGGLNFSYSVIGGSGGSNSWDPDYGIDGGNNLDIDPLFIDPGPGDYRLALGSEAIEAGDNGAPNLASTDLAGAARISGSAVDIGAFEFQIVCPSGPVVYVDGTAAGGNSGDSWANALVSVRGAIQLAQICPGISEIWVAQGTYPLGANVDRFATFRLYNNLEIYGGFDGTETMRSQRDWKNNPTTLTGNMGGGQFERAYSVVTADGVDATAVLDGFTVSEGNGADIYNGAGIRVTNASPTLANLEVRSNAEAYRGGGIYIGNGSPDIVNCWIYTNLSDRGGGVSVNGGNPTFRGCAITDNTSFGLAEGAGVHLTNTNPTFVNVTVANNLTGELSNGCMFYNENSDPVIVNSLLFGCRIIGAPYAVVTNLGGSQPTYQHSLVEGSGGSSSWNSSYGTDLGNNIDANPQFTVDPPDFQTGSPVQNAGNNAAAGVPSTDLWGNPRIVDGTVDIGAVERQTLCSANPILYVDGSATGANDGSSWADAFTDLQDALQVACGSSDIWVAAGTYVPTETDGEQTYQLRNNTGIYGGFNGTESLLAQRDWVGNPTVLSGQDSTGGPLEVVSGSGLAGAHLDGFTLTQSSRPIQVDRSQLTLHNLVVVDNDRESLLQLSSIDIANVVFQDVGGLRLSLCDATLTDCVFIGSEDYALDLFQSDVTATNSLLTGNHDRVIYNNSGTLLIVNSTIANNTSGSSNALLINTTNGIIPSATVEMFNTIVWGNTGDGLVSTCGSCVTTYYHSIVQSSGGSGAWNGTMGSDGGNNLDADPLFANSGAGDFALTASSPAVDAGDGTLPGLPATDLAGAPRVLGAGIDMGAYEFDPTPSGVATETGPRLAFRGAYPNPFNPTLTVAFELDRARAVTVEVFNVRGQLVRTLANATLAAGGHKLTWSGVDRSGNDAASGVYLVRVKSEDWQVLRKVVLLK